MDFELELDRFAYHYIDPRSEAPVYSPAEQPIAEMQAEIREFLLDLVRMIWAAPDAGSTRSARFAVDHPTLGTSQAQPWIDELIAGGEGFFSASRALAELLHRQAPATASPGVLGVLRLVRPTDGQVFAALLKIRYRDEAFVRLGSGSLPLLEVQQVDKILLREIQKGALIPHPEKPAYQLKVIDAQARDDPAAYFTAKFLGCDSKKSDDLQVKKLVPTLERYAEERQLPLKVEKVSDVIAELGRQEESVSAPKVVEVIAGQTLFGEEFEAEDFEEYLGQSDLAGLDVPPEEFQHKRRGPRRLVYRIVDPEYEGLEISGPPEAFRRVLSARDGSVIFTVVVTPDGFEFRYL